MVDDLVEKVARAICREKCAFMGEPPCFVVMDDSPFTFPPETCCEPGCVSEATAAIRVVLEEAAKVAEMYPASMIGGPDAYCRGHIAACTQTAAAIRAMKT